MYTTCTHGHGPDFSVYASNLRPAEVTCDIANKSGNGRDHGKFDLIQVAISCTRRVTITPLVKLGTWERVE